MIKFDYNEFNKTKSIDYLDEKGDILSNFNFEYDDNNQLKLIDKDYNYYYEWDEHSRIKKIIIPDGFYLISEYEFIYLNDQLKLIKSISRSCQNQKKILYSSMYTYTYKDSKIDRVEFKNTKSGDTSYRLYDYASDDKVIITYYTNKDEYEYHYECYY